MKLIIITAAALSLGGCGTLNGLPAPARAEITQGAVEQFGKRCTGHYWGNTGIVAALGFDLTCKPVPETDAPVDPETLRQVIREEIARALAPPQP